MSLQSWVDERIQLSDYLHDFLYHDVPARTNPLDFLGFAALFTFVNQIITGMLLAMFYEGSSKTAYASIEMIMNKVPLGWVIRDLHFWGANFMVVLVFLHMLRIFYTGAYKKPREMTWWIGILLLSITIGLAFTGYLLPWDQQSYWASMVGTAMAGYIPVIGSYIVQLARGGVYMSGISLTRFLSIHMLVLPALLVALFSLHFSLVLRQGMHFIDLAHAKPPEKRPKMVPFFPYIAFQMMVMVLVVGAVLLWAALHQKAPLVAPADLLNRDFYVPVPLWYFYSVYQFLKMVPPSMDTFGMVGLPLIAVIVLVVLPFIDRSPHHSAWKRPWVAGIGTIVLAAVVYLTWLGSVTSVPVTFTKVVANPSYPALIQPLFASNCAVCHSKSNMSGGLDLTSYSAMMKVPGVVVPGHPNKSLLIGHLTGKVPPQMPLGGKPLTEVEIQDVANWIKNGASPSGGGGSGATGLLIVAGAVVAAVILSL